MQPRLHTEGHTIVLLGSFNPQIFLPTWFSNQDLIRKEESEAATIEVVHREVVVFSTDWFRLEVLPERVVFSASQTQFYEVLRDLVLGTFKILRHTPTVKLGINRSIHFLINSVEEWHALGNRLAPKEPWGGILETPGLATLTIQAKRPDESKGYVSVKVEPSKKVAPGVFIVVNDHFEVKDESSAQGADEILEILEKSWSGSIARSLKIAQTLVGAE